MSALARPEFKCPVCGKLLLVGSFTGWVEVVCPRCKKKRTFSN